MEKLQAAGAVAEDDPDAEMTLWAATEGVPKALSAASSKAGKDDARLMDAMIESMATLTEQRVASGGAEAAANTLKSEAVQDSVADVITDAMAVWLEVDPEDEEEAEAIADEMEVPVMAVEVHPTHERLEVGVVHLNAHR